MRVGPKTIVTAIIVVIVLIVLSNMLYVVNETEQVIITQFGEPVGEDVVEAGLHFKLPFVQRANYLEERVLEWDGKPNQIPTKDKLFISVDTYARWRIEQPLLFFKRLRMELRAQSRLDDILDGETRNAIASHELLEIIRSENREAQVDEALVEAGESVGQLEHVEVGREQLCAMIAEKARKRLEGLGIELLDLRFKRINYSEDVRQKIFERMVSERRQIAEKFRSEGQGEAARIDGQREYMLKKINSEAFREAQQIKGQADAEATRIYAEVYNQSEEALDFYQFLKTMETYEATLGKDTRLLMSTDNDLLKYLNGPWSRTSRESRPSGAGR